MLVSCIITQVRELEFIILNSKIPDEQKWKLICDHDGATVKASPAEFVERLKVLFIVVSFLLFFRMLSTCRTTKNTRKIVTLLFNCCES